MCPETDAYTRGACHVMSCHVMSCHVMSCHVTSRHVTSRHVTSRHVMSCHGMACHGMPCHVMSCRAGLKRIRRMLGAMQSASSLVPIWMRPLSRTNGKLSLLVQSTTYTCLSIHSTDGLSLSLGRSVFAFARRHMRKLILWSNSPYRNTMRLRSEKRPLASSLSCCACNCLINFIIFMADEYIFIDFIAACSDKESFWCNL